MPQNPAAPAVMPDLSRIKNNVAKMAAQGAPEQDIDGYIASEGVTVDQVRNFNLGADQGVPLTINGHKVTVDQSFLNLPREQQDATVDEIARSLPPSRKTSIGAIRAQYPQYQDLTDKQLADALHQKFYADMPAEQFYAKVGLDTADSVNARAKAGIERAKAIQNGAPRTQIDPNTGEPVGVPAFTPNGPYSRAGSAAMGAANAVTFGFGDELASYPTSLLTGLPRGEILTYMRRDDNRAHSDNPGSYLAGQIGGGLAQGIATGGAGFGANAARAGATLGRVAANSALDGAIYGGLNGAGNANGGLGDRLSGAASGAFLGGAIGIGAPYVAATIGQGARRLISPFASSPEREAAVQTLLQEGVPITAGQRTGSNMLRYAESELGGSRAATAMENQADAFTNAAMRRAGGSGRATPDNLANLQGSLGQQFQALSARNTIVADRQLAQDLGRTLNSYGRLLETQQKPIINNLVDDIVQRVRAGGGRLSGVEYQAIRSDLSRAAQTTNNQTLKAAFKGLRDSLDDAMERSVNPRDLGAWKALRRQYGNYKVLERASTGGGSDAGLGLISPAQLRVAASTGNRGGFARGASDFTDLAKAGQAVLTPLPNSGTAARSAVRNLGAPLGSAGLGYAVGNLPGAIAGAAVPYVAGRALMSAPIQRYLGNQVAAGSLDPARNALAAALLRNSAIPAIEGR
ncbi:hypothetical protein EN780_03030 [Mesorhizobium sp. M4B.F.Ca.ET.089.01.1.1]|uniref:hypothetical protein n=1 Tax=Mesorhizobium sp. M4B.F.Ca.ET.089.01.1.1 TaxID=2496662 RepID=UPI000FE38E6B|nr:hypothetical protein [Mesorhizobium sp. M4B.F.Ca.ET.089.01.1.1]RWX70510.1 hypothetical protein EN780_03030 [Mesorhizobium sp. M4B.F.Ca.ET.089.01.1.1]